MRLTFSELPAYVSDLLGLEGEKLLNFFLYLKEHLTIAVLAVIEDSFKLDQLIQYYYCTYTKEFFGDIYDIDLTNCSVVNFYELSILFETETQVEYCFDTVEKAYQAQTELEQTSVFNIIKHKGV
jgi:hypothetical protein